MKILKKISMLVSLLFAMIYYLIIQIEIDVHPPQSNIVRFEVTSKIVQEVKLNIHLDHLPLQSIKCNNKVRFLWVDHEVLWFENQVEEIHVMLDKGNNICEVLCHDVYSENRLIVKRKMTFSNYIILYILLGIPIFNMIFTFFIWVLNKIKRIYFEA